MLITVVEVIASAWVIYSVWRVIAAPQNAIEVSTEALAKCPREFCYNTYLQVREYYLKLSTAHKKYEPSNPSQPKEGFIDVWETAGFQFVKHRYRIVNMVPNERMNLVSERSEVRVLGLFRSHTRSEVEFRFKDAPEKNTSLGLTIRIIFPNWIRHLLARLFFTEAIWQAHAREEMSALAQVMQKRYENSNVAPS